DRDAVQTEIQNVASAAAEGTLVAEGVEQGRTFRSFSVIRTAELHKVAMHASESLRETPAEAGLGASARKGADLGDRVAGLLASVTKRPVVDVVRQRMGFGVGFLTLLASEAINILTVAAEVGGVALGLQLLFADIPFRVLALIAVSIIVVLVWVLPFGGIERVFGYLGLALAVYIVAAIK